MTKRPGIEEEEALGVSLAILRLVRGWTQEELGRKAKVRSASISDYELGKATPGLRTLQKLLSAMGFSLTVLEETQGFVERLRRRAGTEKAGPRLPKEAFLEEILNEIEALSSEFGKVISGLLHVFLTALAGSNLSRRERETLRAASPSPVAEKSEEASRLLERLRGLSFASQQRLVSDDVSFHTWSVERLLCRKSIAAAGENPKEAIKLALLAELVSRHVEGEESERGRFQGYALAHLANAHRACGNLPEAARAFSDFDAVWTAGKPDDPVDEAVVHALKASLRRTEGKFEEALALHDLALRSKDAEEMRAELLVSKAYTLDERGDLPGVVVCLEEARASLTGKEDPRLLLALRHNLLDALSKLGRFEEAKTLLAEVKRMAGKIGSDLDFARIEWTEGRIEAGLGNSAEGARLLLRARGAFAAKGIPFDTALVTLELAILYKKEGRVDALRNIARHLAPLFQAQALPQETLGALALFRQAAEAENVTAEFLGRLLEYLRKARSKPGLVFEPGA